MIETMDQHAERVTPLLFAPEFEGKSGAMFNQKGLAIHASPSLDETYVRELTAASQTLISRAMGS